MLRSVFGSCYGFGINDRKPNIGKSLLPKANTTINILKSSTVDDTFRIRTLSKGIDFIYNISINRLTIKLRIEQFIIPKTGISSQMECYAPLKEVLIGIQNTTIENSSSDESNDVNRYEYILVGAEFTIDDNTYAIQTINEIDQSIEAYNYNTSQNNTFRNLRQINTIIRNELNS